MTATESNFDSGYSHTFPAIRGVQAGRSFYIAMCPMRIIPKIFMFDEEEVPATLRAQRVLNRNRIPELSSYLVDNPDGYVLSALTASINSEINFLPAADSGPQANMGMLSIPMDAQILINDGQHRRAAIEAAMNENPELGFDNVPVLFFIDVQLQRSQQMFADLNKYAVRPSTSLSTLYDHRDSSSDLARYLALTTLPFKGFTELEKSSISNRSTKLFTLSSIKHANRALFRKGAKDAFTDEERDLAASYWQAVTEVISDWQQVVDKKVAAAELRENYIHSHGIALQALGVLGAELLQKYPKDWRRRLVKLNSVDWSRSNADLWEGRATIHGRISKARSNITLTANVLKNKVGLELSEDEKTLEQKYGT